MPDLEKGGKKISLWTRHVLPKFVIAVEKYHRKTTEEKKTQKVVLSEIAVYVVK